MNVKKTIAKAIKKADRSYFFENYDKQADAVIRALEEDFIILPKEPDKAKFIEVADKMATGKMKPEEHIKDVYQTITKVMQA